MNEKANIVYNSALENKSFLFEIYEAYGKKPPTIYSTSVDKYGFCVLYQGWLLGKYGKDWKSHL